MWGEGEKCNNAAHNCPCKDTLARQRLGSGCCEILIHFFFKTFNLSRCAVSPSPPALHLLSLLQDSCLAQIYELCQRRFGLVSFVVCLFVCRLRLRLSYATAHVAYTRCLLIETECAACVCVCVCQTIPFVQVFTAAGL